MTGYICLLELLFVIVVIIASCAGKWLGSGVKSYILRSHSYSFIRTSPLLEVTQNWYGNCFNKFQGFDIFYINVQLLKW